MNQTIEVKFSEIKSLIQRAFPNAKSRRPVRIEGCSTYRVRDFWDGGSRDECRFLNLSTLQVMSSEDIPHDVRQKAANPYNLPIATVNLTPGYCVVEHIIFQGKDLGYRIYVSKERYHMLSEGANAMLDGNVVKQLTVPYMGDKMLPENT